MAWHTVGKQTKIHLLLMYNYILQQNNVILCDAIQQFVFI